MTLEGFVFFCVITAIVTGIILFICSAITVWRYSDEVEALVLGPEEWNPAYKVDARPNGGSWNEPGLVRVKYKYKGVVYRTDLKGFIQRGRTIKVRVNPKKPNQCCKTYPDMSGLFMCLSFAVVVLYIYFKAKQLSN